MIKDLFVRDINRSIQGVVTIGNEDEEQKWQELEEYVCTEEIIKSFRTFFRRYRESLVTPTEKIGVWITGFFGSGKSHFLKILGYILANEEIAGWRASRYFQEKIKDQIVMADLEASAMLPAEGSTFSWSGYGSDTMTLTRTDASLAAKCAKAACENMWAITEDL